MAKIKTSLTRHPTCISSLQYYKLPNKKRIKNCFSMISEGVGFYSRVGLNGADTVAVAILLLGTEDCCEPAHQMKYYFAL